MKWFNVSKGFGFIRRQNGEEIFVHFRSIREPDRSNGGSKGNGRRGSGRERRALRDGQRVSFVVVDSDKGPQAEEVEALR
ncbi:MAG: cold shock domain-containing protein [Halieaceae bacterium]|nr:cold shock domain-containing protein [Halieaceae bacterium]